MFLEQPCHLAGYGRVKMNQMFFLEILDVSEWFKPHLEGYLADQLKRHDKILRKNDP